MDTSRVDGVKAPQHRGTPRSHLRFSYSRRVLELHISHVSEDEEVRVVAYDQGFSSTSIYCHALIRFFGALQQRQLPSFRRV